MIAHKDSLHSFYDQLTKNQKCLFLSKVLYCVYHKYIDKSCVDSLLDEFLACYPRMNAYCVSHEYITLLELDVIKFVINKNILYEAQALITKEICSNDCFIDILKEPRFLSEVKNIDTACDVCNRVIKIFCEYICNQMNPIRCSKILDDSHCLEFSDINM